VNALATSVQAAVEEAIERAVARGEVGLAVTVYHHGELVADAFGGIADENTGREVDRETVFWLGSVTKALCAVGLHMQAERGLVDYATPVAEYWPEFAVHGKDRGTVLDALSHRLGVPLFPIDATPELMCDFDWVAGRIAGMHPLHEPGTKNAYHTYTFGYVIGELVRRVDPKHRRIDVFLREELFEPLGADALWLGIPADVEPRVANLTDRPVVFDGTVPYDRLITFPPSVAPLPAVFGRSDVRRGVQPSAGAIGSSSSVARVFAMLAGGGELDGVRLLSDDRVRLFSAPRPEGWDVMMGANVRISIGGFWLPLPREGHSSPMGNGFQIFGHTGVGGNIAWCDVRNRLAVAITANRLDARSTPKQNPLNDIAGVIRRELGVEG
jgi:CubicO group peptidase (beta-lactamase class C family)